MARLIRKYRTASDGKKIFKGYYARWYDRNRAPRQKEVSLRTKDRDVAQERLQALNDLWRDGKWCPWSDGASAIAKPVHRIEPQPDDPVTTETWRPVPGFVGYYLVSNHGRIKNADTGQILSPTPNSSGYLKCNLHRGGRGKTLKVHRLVAEAFVEGASDDLTVNHINGCKTDNRAGNLEWITQEANLKHAHRTGLFRSTRWAL